MRNHSYLSEEEKKEIKEILNKILKNKVEVEVILDENNEFSNLAKNLCTEISELNNLLSCRFFDVNSEEGKNFIKNFEFILNKNETSPIIFYKDFPNIIHFGFPLGKEFPVFLEELKIISSKEISLPLNVSKMISKINKKVNLLTFVTSTCPYCPNMSLSNHMFAYLNRNINGIIVEAEQFPILSEKFEVFAVPKTVVIVENEIKEEFEGLTPQNIFSEKILKALES